MGILLNKSKNYIINGAMDFFQRGISFATAVSGQYVADRINYSKLGTMVQTVSRDTDVPTLAQSGFPFSYSVRMNLTTSQASLTTNQHNQLLQRIEGQFASSLYGKTITISFWVKATLVGVYPVAFRSGNGLRSYVSTYTINTTNTWEKKTITLTHDNIGTWAYDTGVGLDVMFTLAAGPSFVTSSLNSWVDGNFISHTSCVNGVQAGATDFRITGVQLEEGVSASNFERAGGNIANELQLCQRYFEKSYNVDVPLGSVTVEGVLGSVSNSAIASPAYVVSLHFITRKRVVPIINYYNSSTGGIGSWRDNGGVDVGVGTYVSSLGTRGVSVAPTAASTNGRVFVGHFAADAEL